MNPDYVLFAFFISLCGFLYSLFVRAKEGILDASGIVLFISFFLGLIAPWRVTILEPTSVHVTKGQNAVMVEAIVDGEHILKINKDIVFYNNVKKPQYKIVYKIIKTPFYFPESENFELVEKP